MTSIRFDFGAPVSYAGKNWRVQHSLDFEQVVLEDSNGNERIIAPISELRSEIALECGPVPSTLLPDVSTQEWAEARRRYSLIKPLLGAGGCTKAEVRRRAAECKASVRTLYRFLKRFNQTHQISSLLPRRTRGGKGKGRLSPEIERLTSEVVELYLKKQRFTKKDIWIEVLRRCKAVGVKPPSQSAVVRRVNWLKPLLVIRRRYGAKAAKPYEAHPGQFDRAQYPLAVVQIDHTKLDAIVVDGEFAQPIGRPWITLVLDVYSRMVLGYYISLDPSGALSTGLAIAQAIMRKDAWLRSRDVAGKWPCWGVMQCIHADNALEFHGKMLERACQEYRIDLMFRRPGEPHFGGHIERCLGTMLRDVHKLPGTTFGSIKERANYDPDGTACLTLDDLDHLIGRWIVEIYHQRKHRELNTSPIRKWEEGFFGPNRRPLPMRIEDERKLRLDFMPFTERTIQPAGVEFEGLHYFSDVLRSWVRVRLPASARSRKFTFAFDPRDISRLFFFDPDTRSYSEVPFRDTSRGPASIWEARTARQRLREEGKSHVDEAMILDKIGELRRDVEQRAAKSRKLLREKQRNIQHVKSRNYVTSLAVAAQFDAEEVQFEDPVDQSPVERFDVEKL